MAACNTEYDFDCPRFAYELNSSNNVSDSEINYIDPWFLCYHADHDREVQSSAEVEEERSSYGRSSTAGSTKSNASQLGPVRISRHQSSTITSSAQSSFSSGRRGSQKGDDSKINDVKNQIISKVTRLSSGTKRKIALDKCIESSETVIEAPATDMRDKLDEFRQRKKRDNANEQSIIPPITKISIPPTDYSRSKIVLSAPSTAPAPGGDSSSAILAHAKKLTASAHSTSARAEGKRVPSTAAKTVAVSSRSFPQKLATQTATKSSTSSSSSNNKHLDSRKASTKESGAAADNASMMELLKKHNQRFAPVPMYEPPRHSVRDVRQWEKLSGKTWLSLKPEEREVVNAEISKTKEAAKNDVGR